MPVCQHNCPKSSSSGADLPADTVTPLLVVQTDRPVLDLVTGTGAEHDVRQHLTFKRLTLSPSDHSDVNSSSPSTTGTCQMMLQVQKQNPSGCRDFICRVCTNKTRGHCSRNSCTSPLESSVKKRAGKVKK